MMLCATFSVFCIIGELYRLKKKNRKIFCNNIHSVKSIFFISSHTFSMEKICQVARTKYTNILSINNELGVCDQVLKQLDNDSSRNNLVKKIDDWPYKQQYDQNKTSTIHDITRKTTCSLSSSTMKTIIPGAEIDKFLDFQRARIDNTQTASKRKNSEQPSPPSPPIDTKIRCLSAEPEKLNYQFCAAVTQLSSEMAIKLRSQCHSILHAECHLSDQIRAFCYFCEKFIKQNLSTWRAHLLKHTGENEFYCNGCQMPFSSKNEEHCLGWNICSTFTATELNGFLCNICNYLQINISRIIRHVVMKHQKLEREADNFITKVILIPDLHQLPPIQTKYKFIMPGQRYKCGINECNSNFNQSNEFTQHFETMHMNEKSFCCPHCMEMITNAKSNVKTVLSEIYEHLYLHGRIVGQCIVCEKIFSNNVNTISHMLEHHSTIDCTFHFDIRKKNLDSQEIIVLFECNTCQAQFRTHSASVYHYLNQHNSHNANFTLIRLAKKLKKDKTPIRFVQLNDEKLFFQQHFACHWCQKSLTSKAILIQHCIAKHRFKDLLVTFTKSYLTDRFLMHTPNFDQYLMFYCGQCTNNSSVYTDVDDVYNHWSSNHKKVTPSKPFRFTVAQLVVCHYCDVIGTFEGNK